MNTIPLIKTNSYIGIRQNNNTNIPQNVNFQGITNVLPRNTKTALVGAALALATLVPMTSRASANNMENVEDSIDKTEVNADFEEENDEQSFPLWLGALLGIIVAGTIAGFIVDERNNGNFSY